MTDRLRIEAWLRVKLPVKEIARQLGVHNSTVYREIRRGRYMHLNSELLYEERYAAEIGERKKQEYLRAKGRELKIGNDHVYARYLEYMIGVEKYAPGAVLGEIRRKGLEFNTTISKTTLYRYIDMGLFLTVSNKDLPVKKNRTGQYKRVHSVPAKAPRGESIERRPEEIGERETFGHWEMDCVVGKKGTTAALLVLTERKTRKELIRLMPDKTAASVVAALDGIERAYGNDFLRVFRSITVDNGVEFSDCEGMEKSIAGGQRTKMYFCHPYSAYERGSNENQNRMIRRHFPKGCSFESVTAAEVRKVEKWLNNYPRRLFDYYSAEDLFQACLASIA